MSSLELAGRGTLSLVTRADIAGPSGATILFTVPGYAPWAPLALRFVYRSSATVGTRYPDVAFDDGVALYAVIPGTPGLTAGQAAGFTFLSGFGADLGTVAGAAFARPMPDVELLPGHRIRFSPGAFLAGDTVDSISLYVRQFPPAAPDYQRQQLLVDPRVAELAIGG